MKWKFAVVAGDLFLVIGACVVILAAAVISCLKGAEMPCLPPQDTLIAQKGPGNAPESNSGGRAGETPPQDMIASPSANTGQEKAIPVYAETRGDGDHLTWETKDGKYQVSLPFKVTEQVALSLVKDAMCRAGKCPLHLKVELIRKK